MYRRNAASHALQSAHDAVLLSLGLDGYLHLYPHPQGLFNITDASRIKPAFAPYIDRPLFDYLGRLPQTRLDYF